MSDNSNILKIYFSNRAPWLRNTIFPPNYYRLESSVLSDVLRAIASPLRVSIIKALSNEGKKLSAVAQELGITSEQLVYHLKQLREAGLVTQSDNLYMLSPTGRKVLELLLELESDFLEKKDEPLVVDSLGTLQPLRAYLKELIADLCPLNNPGARSKRMKLLTKTLEELSSYGSLIPAQFAALILSAHALREGCFLIKERGTSYSTGYLSSTRLEASLSAIRVLSECGLLDFASLKLVNFFISPDTGFLALYTSTPDYKVLRGVISEGPPLREVAVKIDEASQSKGTLEALLVLSRYLYVSLITNPETFSELSRDENFGSWPLRNLLLTFLLRHAADIKNDNAQYISQALNRGAATLFSFQDVIPSLQMLAMNTREDAQVHLGACAISVSQVIHRARKLGKDPWELLGKIIPKIEEVFLRLKKQASTSLAPLIESFPQKPVFRAQISLLDVEEGFLASELSADMAGTGTYAYRLVNWIEELVEFLTQKAQHITDELSLDLTFYAPPETVNPEFLKGNATGLTPLSPFKGSRHFEELLLLENLLSLRMNRTLSVLNVRVDTVNTIQLQQVIELVENNNIRLFTLTVTDLKYCRSCGNIFGKTALRCPRCQSARVGSLMRNGLLYVPEYSV